MTILESLAGFVHGVVPGRVSHQTIDRLRLHLFDTIGAIAVGSRLPEGAAMRAAMRHAPTAGTAMTPTRLGSAVAIACACARCTEMDDIHLASCTTPGAIVIPTALALLAAGYLRSFSDFVAAVIAGYDLVVRLGLAIDGPARLADRVWPTRFAAPVGAAAVTARALGLDPGQTAGALATALASASGTSIAPRPTTTSRWLGFGVAARHGVEAAQWALDDVRGNADLVERCAGRINGIDVSATCLLDARGDRLALDDVGLKPYPVARQALAAVEACLALAREHHLDPATVSAVTIGLPHAQRPIVDHPGMPADRFATLVSVQYLAAVALVDPDRLLDAQRDPPFDHPVVRRIASRVEIVHAPDLDRLYPTAWPARVTIVDRDRRVTSEIVQPVGDVSTSFGWTDVTRKLVHALDGLSDAPDIDHLASTIQALDFTSALPDLWGLTQSGSGS